MKFTHYLIHVSCYKGLCDKEVWLFQTDLFSKSFKYSILVHSHHNSDVEKHPNIWLSWKYRASIYSGYSGDIGMQKSCEFSVLYFTFCIKSSKSFLTDSVLLSHPTLALTRVGLLNQFPPFHYSFFAITGYLLNVIFIFDRCHHIWAVVTPVKYESDSKQPNRYFHKMKNFLNWEINRHGLSTPHPLISYLCWQGWRVTLAGWSTHNEHRPSCTGCNCNKASFLCLKSTELIEKLIWLIGPCHDEFISHYIIQNKKDVSAMNRLSFSITSQH